jgi:PAS domain S-box-containing protein
MRIVHVEDNTHDASLVHAMITRHWPECELHRVDNRTDFERALDEKPPDLILSDFSLPSFDGLSALAVARQRRPGTPFIFLSGTIGEEVAVEALRNGALDYVLKDRMGRLIPAIQRALAEAGEHTRRRAAEDALRETQERFRHITENVADLIAVLDTQGRRIYNNPAYRSLIGEVETRPGTDSFNDIHPEDRERIRAIFGETVRTGKGQRAEYRFMLNDGSVRFIESQGSVLRDSSGRVINVLVVSRDVTERKKSEERIRAQASLLDKARDGICVVDLAHRITFWSAGAEALFGWTVEEAVGRDVVELLFNGSKFKFTAAEQALRAQGRWEGELRPATKSKRSIVVESRWTLVTDNHGLPGSILLINTDVTEKKKLETQFLRAQRMESIGTLAGGIAHDLNNVLTPILVASQVLQGNATKRGDAELLQTIEKSALHGAALVKQVLLFARGAHGEHTALHLRHIIGDMEKLLRETFPRSIEIRTQVDRDLWLVHGDATQLNQVLMNLCVNARDAMPSGGRITVSATNTQPGEDVFRAHPGLKPGSFVMLSVQDNGTGIPPEIIDHIFDPFFTTKEAGKGTGLGLSTVIGIIKGHNGAVNVVSEPEKGARFEIFLPALPAEKPPAVNDSRSPLPKGQGEGVLVIDDEVFIREAVTSMLRHCGYTAFVAETGREGISLYLKNRDKIRLALVDIMMPGLDGFTTIRLLRDASPDLKIVAISGMLDNERFGTAPELRGVDLLRKPVSAEVLMGKIAAALRSEAG